jgi:hypothetical protein
MKYLSERAARQAARERERQAALTTLTSGTPNEQRKALKVVQSQLAEARADPDEPDIHECLKCGKEFSVDRANARIGCETWVECDETGRPVMHETSHFELAICARCLPKVRAYRAKR